MRLAFIAFHPKELFRDVSQVGVLINRLKGFREEIKLPQSRLPLLVKRLERLVIGLGKVLFIVGTLK